MVLFLLQQTVVGQGLEGVERAIRTAREDPGDPDDGWAAERRNVPLVRTAVRDWVLRRLPPGIVDSYRDLSSISAALNDQLKKSDLYMPKGDFNDVPFRQWGYSTAIELRRVDEVPSYIELRISVSTACGSDDAAYFLLWRAGRWTIPAFIDGSNNSAKFAAAVDEIKFSEADNDGNRLLLGLRQAVQCASAWSAFTYDIFRIHPDGTAEQLSSASHGIYDGWGNLENRVLPDSVLMEFADSSIDDAVHNRPTILHFQLQHDTLERVDPIALRPFDFVDEWWKIDWKEAVKWSSSSNSKLRSFHDTERPDQVFGEFGFVQRCKNESDWQISYDVDPNNVMQETAKKGIAGTIYFLIRETGKYQYLMLDVDTKRQPGCPGEDQLDIARPSLFKNPPGF